MAQYAQQPMMSTPAGLAQIGAQNSARLSEVQAQVERSSNVIGRLGDRMKLLNERLGSVLRNTSSLAKGSETSPPRPTLVGHATALSNQNDQLDLIDEALNDILDRLEL